MTRDEVLDALEPHGLGQSELEAILVFFQTRRNGAATLHMVHGQLANLDIRLVVPPRTHALHQLKTLLTEVIDHDNNGLS
jgi:hypothetical protein